MSFGPPHRPSSLRDGWMCGAFSSRSDERFRRYHKVKVGEYWEAKDGLIFEVLTIPSDDVTKGEHLYDVRTYDKGTKKCVKLLVRNINFKRKLTPLEILAAQKVWTTDDDDRSERDKDE